MITIIIGYTKCKICNLTDAKAIKELDYRMSYEVQGHQFMNAHSGWDGRQRLFTKNHYFPVGLLTMAETILKKHNLEYKIQDNRETANYGASLTENKNGSFSTRDYQIQAVDVAFNVGSGIIKMATGAGKSLIISKIIGRYNLKSIIYVIGIDLMYQMRDTLRRLYPGLKVGLIGDGHCEIQKINVATIQTASAAFGKKAKLFDSDIPEKKEKQISEINKSKLRELVNQAELIILDECQVAASETVKLLHEESKKARHRFLLSGTPWRQDGSDILIEAVGGPIIFDLPASKLIEAGWLVPPKIHFLEVPQKRNLGKTYQEVYKSYVVENEERNQLIIKAAKKMIEKGRKVLILVTSLNHGKILLKELQKDIEIASLDGSDDSASRIQTMNDLREGKIQALIASKIFDQGIDLPELDAMILAGSGKSSGRALQRIGRVIRTGPPNKKDAIVVDFIDNCKYLKDHSQARIKIYLTEPNFKVILPKIKEEE